ncbi:MAG: DedA family protein [Gemmatimonadaceae bacterium]
MDDFFAWLTDLPAGLLYLMLGVTAAIENFFPPLPADTVVAFGSFLAARGNAALWGAFLAAWLGNITGAMIVFGLARRYGANEMQVRLKRYGRQTSEQKLEHWYAKYGILALFLSRFLPGIRALVPPFAGALRMRPLPVFLAISSASAVFYGLITYVAYRVGANWDTLESRVGDFIAVAAQVAGVLVVIGLIWWLIRKRRIAREGGPS